MTVCPVKAIGREENLNYVKIDYDLCIGCRACVTACPFGAMSFNMRDRKVFKCDLCEGEPNCVRFCEVKAVDYVDADRVSMGKKRDAALKQSEAQKKAAALEANE
jgi:Fe-S-cluster-containing hydrogenase component 2